MWSSSRSYSLRLVVKIRPAQMARSCLRLVIVLLLTQLLPVSLALVTRFQPYLPELIRKSMEYALSARDPINYFMLLRALFRSIGGGLHDILYSQFLPLLPDLMLFFNKLQVRVAISISVLNGCKSLFLVVWSPTDDARIVRWTVLDCSRKVIDLTSSFTAADGAARVRTKWWPESGPARWVIVFECAVIFYRVLESGW